MKRKVLLFLLFTGALSGFRADAVRADKELVFAVHPFLPATQLLQKFQPLVAHVGRESGRQVRIEISRDYEEHIRAVGEGEVDFAYMGPASYVRLVEAYGRPFLLARLEVEGTPVFYGHIFVRDESPIRNLEGLRGANFAFGSASSTMGNLVPRYVLRQAGVPLAALGNYSFLSNHENVAMAVLVGDFDAGAVKEETFGKYRSEGLRSLARTPAISEHLFVATAALSPEAAAALRRILLGAGAHEEGRRGLRSIKKTVTGLVPVEDSDYDGLRSILGAAGQLKGPP